MKEKEDSESLFAAKYMKDTTEYGNEEVEILKKLQNCDKIIDLVEEYHENYQTILITEYLTGMKHILVRILVILFYLKEEIFLRDYLNLNII